jgi:membrane glycosyltransferase
MTRWLLAPLWAALVVVGAVLAVVSELMNGAYDATLAAVYRFDPRRRPLSIIPPLLPLHRWPDPGEREQEGPTRWN